MCMPSLSRKFYQVDPVSLEPGEDGWHVSELPCGDGRAHSAQGGLSRGQGPASVSSLICRVAVGAKPPLPPVDGGELCSPMTHSWGSIELRNVGKSPL